MSTDIIFPSSNKWGIPDLHPKFQAKRLIAPFRGWGQVPRKRKFAGTFHFFTYDYKFSALWKYPKTLIRTECPMAVEPNFTTHDQFPKALGIAEIYKKRWLSRFWQSYGIEILVDLNIDESFFDIGFIGVPQGWNAFATRASDAEFDSLLNKIELAENIAQTKNIFLVIYCGGPKVRELCHKNQYIYIGDNGNAQGRRNRSRYPI